MSNPRSKKIAVPASKKRKGAASSSGLYTEEFMDDNELDTLHCYIHYSPSKCWSALVPGSATYDPSRSKASTLAPSLSILASPTQRRKHLPLPSLVRCPHRASRSAEEEDLEDITDDVPPHHEDPPSQPPPIHRPVHAAASYSDISNYKELQSSPSLRNLKLRWKRFSTTAMSYPATTITSSLDTVVVEPNLYHHQSILLQFYHCLG
ncbi:hypothetical protein GOBAR_AA22682 [Gossypium barbadense]|uniref:Uncharacterized protein n=1 Tax=Gossypium barbadense TaxID=3634 RepID=A0A2P5X3R1_GOSBA|nr:hypothetical protein GOBAR_AA22682 [Gossypium barbadense]